jgi:hypothetical protein
MLRELMKYQAAHEAKPKNHGLKPAEREERIDFAADQLLKSRFRKDWYDAIQTKYGVGWRQAARYIALARKRMLQATKKPREQLIAEAVDFYRSVVKDERLSHKSRMAAQRRIDKLLGLEAPTKVIHTSPYEEMTAEELARIAAERGLLPGQGRIIDAPVHVSVQPQAGGEVERLLEEILAAEDPVDSQDMPTPSPATPGEENAALQSRDLLPHP